MQEDEASEFKSQSGRSVADFIGKQASTRGHWSLLTWSCYRVSAKAQTDPVRVEGAASAQPTHTAPFQMGPLTTGLLYLL